jgi:hypothetical protein
MMHASYLVKKGTAKLLWVNWSRVFVADLQSLHVYLRARLQHIRLMRRCVFCYAVVVNVLTGTLDLLTVHASAFVHVCPHV